MASFKFIHAADLHLDSPLRGLERYEGAPADEIRCAARKALEKLVRLAIDESCSFVIIAGDVYDGDWRDYNTGLFFVQQMSALRAAEIPVYLVHGNHDAANRITKSLPLPDNVHVFTHARPETVRVDHLDVAVHGQSFASQSVTANLAAGFPPAVPGAFNIGILHTSADGRPDHDSYAPCSPNDLKASGYDYWALGHIHAREIVLSSGPWIVFPGNTQGRHIGEPGPKGCSLVTVEEGCVASVTHRDLHEVLWSVIEIDAEGCAVPEEVLSIARERIEDEISASAESLVAVRVIVRGASAAHGLLLADHDRWIAELRARTIDAGCGRLWLERVQIRTTAPETAETASDGADDLNDFLDGLSENPAAISELADALKPLREMLPIELRQRAESGDLCTEAHVRASLEAVRQLLAVRLKTSAP